MGFFDLDAETLVSIFVESTLYGLFMFLFVVSTVILLRRRSRHGSTTHLNKPMLATSFIMFTLATIHVGVELRRMLEAFLNHADGKRGPIEYLYRLDTALFLIKSFVFNAQTFVGDGFMIYRVYMVWNGDKRVVFPLIICLLASIAAGLGATLACARADPGDAVFAAELQAWIASFLSLTLFTNFTSTILIAVRIWWVHRRVIGSSVTSGKVTSAAVVIVESGAIYSVCLVIMISLYLTGSYAQYILLDAVTQVIGITFSLVIVRVALEVSSTVPNGTIPTRLTLFESASDGLAWQSDSGRSRSVQPVTVKVTTATHSDMGHRNEFEMESSKAQSPYNAYGDVTPDRQEL